METRKIRTKTWCLIAGAALFAGLLPLTGAWAHHHPQEVVSGDPQEGVSDGGSSVSGIEALRKRMEGRLNRPDMHAPMIRRDAMRAAIRGDDTDYDYDYDSDDDEAGGLPNRLDLISRGRRLEPDATTDVWALGDFAYTGTFNSPCGGEGDAGVQVWKVDDDDDDSKLVTFPIATTP